MPTKKESNPGLLSRPIPEIISKQIDIFARGIIHDQPVMTIDPTLVIKKLENTSGQKVIGVDIGGDKLFQQRYKVQNSQLKEDGKGTKIKNDLGAGYIKQLEEISINQKGLPVGISIGIPLSGTIALEGHKLSALHNDLKKYNDDFAQLFKGALTCLNDGPAGLISGILHANSIYKNEIENFIFVINGGGIGASVFTNNTIFSTEPGQISLIPELNQYNDNRISDKHTSRSISMELAAGNKLGIEYQWQKQTGQNLNAIEIEKQYTEGKPQGNLALELYDYSALVVSHLVLGLAHAFDIDISNKSTVVIGHGGAFKFPQYGDRVKQIIDEDRKTDVKFISTNDYSTNACAEGAAIAAVAEL